MRIVLLPGLDGTGSLFDAFVSSLPAGVDTQIIVYPTQDHLSYQQLEEFVFARLPLERGYVILAESFSGPIALRIANRLQGQVSSVVLVASFAYRPLSWRGAIVAWLPLERLLKFPPPGFILRAFLAGASAPADLLNKIRRAISQVNSKVLAGRLNEVLTSGYCCQPVSCAAAVTAIFASKDRLIGRVALESIYSICPEAAIETVPGPHLVLQTNPGAVVAALVRHGILP